MNSANKRMNSKYQYVGFLPTSVRIKENGFWGLNDFEGNEILPSNYIEVFTLSSGYGLIAARDAGFWDIYDYDGNKLNSQPYDVLYPYYGFFGMTKIKIGDKWGVINKFGRTILPVEYKKIEKFGRGMTFHTFSGEIKFIDRDELIHLTEATSTPKIDIVKQSIPKNIISFPQRRSRIK